MNVVPFFEWLDATWLASFAKTYAGLFSMVQAVHILSMVMLVGMIILGDLRMLNVVLKGVPSDVIIQNTKKWIYIGLVGIVLSGIYEASAIAMKLAYNSFFWAKMAGLAMGIVFMLSFRSAVYSRAPETIASTGPKSDAVEPWVVKLVASASLLIWFSVAANGRWIGFS
ncbi:MAG: hypothetical protein P1U52_08585 [Porticoccaceae bacterium]|nr:hypothetical protein [Porticoccaceae bacterium]